MKKALKILGAALGAIILGVFILSLIAEKHITITTKQFISSSKQEVFDEIRYMKNYPNWSPFRVQDPEQKYLISGNDGEVGATFHWEGVKEESKGYQTVVAISGTEQVKIACNITVPFQANPTFDYTLFERDGGVELVQDFAVEMPFPANVFGLLFGLKDQMAQVNRQGLELLKKNLEGKKS